MKRLVLPLLVLACSVTWSTRAVAEKRAADFALEVLQGQGSGSLDHHRGQVVILEFWATYCGWCKATHPTLAAFADKHSGRVTVLGISAQKKSRLRKYLASHTTGFTVLHDPGAKVSRNYRADRTPTLVVIDAKGVIRAWAQGGNKLKHILQVATKEAGA